MIGNPSSFGSTGIPGSFDSRRSHSAAPHGAQEGRSMQSPGRTVAIVNQKGGAAKTTTAVNLAAALAKLGHAVLLIDLDPQGSATRWLGADSRSTALTDVLLHEGRLDDAVVPTAIDRVELVPASEPLNAADHDLARVIGGQVRLRDALADIRRRDFILLDC